MIYTFDKHTHNKCSIPLRTTYFPKLSLPITKPQFLLISREKHTSHLTKLPWNSCIGMTINLIVSMHPYYCWCCCFFLLTIALCCEQGAKGYDNGEQKTYNCDEANLQWCPPRLSHRLRGVVSHHQQSVRRCLSQFTCNRKRDRERERWREYLDRHYGGLCKTSEVTS